MSPALRWTVLTVATLALILVPFALFEEPIAAWTEQTIQGGGSKPYLAALLAGLLVVDIFVPVPATVVSLAAGYTLGFALGAAVIWSGMTAGALVGYGLGVRLGRAVTRRWLGEAELARAERLHRRFGPAALLLARGMPVLAEATVVFAGVTAMRRWRFLGLVAVSNAVLALAYAALGVRLTSLF